MVADREGQVDAVVSDLALRPGSHTAQLVRRRHSAVPGGLRRTFADAGLPFVLAADSAAILHAGQLGLAGS